MQPAGEMKRAAFKVSRLEQSQLTGDTLQDSDMLNLGPMGSIQFDDQSTESDATFGGLLMPATTKNATGANHSMQNTPAALRQVRSISQTGRMSSTKGLGGKPLVPSQPQMRIATHLNECNYIRCQRSDLVADRRDQLAADQALVCDCGAFERASQQMQIGQQQVVAMQRQPQMVSGQPLQQHQLPLQGSSHDFDDSDEFVQQQHMVYGGAGGGGVRQMDNQQQERRYANFRQQSSELTCEDDDDDDDDDDEDDDDDDLDADVEDLVNNSRLNHRPMLVDDDDKSNDLGPVDSKIYTQNQQQQVYRVPRSIVRNEELRDAPIMSSKHLSGSRTSIKSCTCGSELALDAVGVLTNDDEEDESSLNNKSSNNSKSTKRSAGQGNPTQKGQSSTSITTTTPSNQRNLSQNNKLVEANCDTITTGTTNTTASTTTDTPTTNTRSSGTSNTATGTTTKTALGAQVVNSAGNN